MSAAGTETRSTGPVGDGTPRTVLRVANVAKAFGATQAVRDASFELHAGEVLVLVGENGCGKSTMVKILSGVHQPDAGTIELDGSPVSAIRMPRDAQNHGIFTVFQEVLVAESCSVLDNVWLGADGTWQRRVSGREKTTRAKQLLARLLGREIDVSMAVEELSLSDRQACGIVRALLRNPKILILDEATSALDAATERKLQGALETVMAGRTTFVIAHRLATIRDADRILVFHEGRIVEAGTFDQLVAEGGRFAELARAQFMAAQAEEDDGLALAA